MSQFHQLRVAEVRRETPDAVSLTFAVPDALRQSYRYQAGQHLALRTRIDGEEVMRTYSICSGVEEQRLRVAVKRQPHGRFSGYANAALRPGQMLEVMEPRGHFTAVPEPGRARHHLAFAAGSGITPVLSILKTLLAAEPQSRFTLVYGNRDTRSMIFREELEDLKNRYMARLNLITVMSREQPEVELLHGHIDGPKCDALLARWIDPGDVDECYLCGPEPMIESVRACLERHGLDRDHIHQELFTAPGEARRRSEARRQDRDADHSVTEVTVVVDGLRTRFELERNSASVLEAGLAAGADLPFSCKGGVCATCRARLLEGRVEMDVNYALEAHETAAGYVLTCQSYPVTDTVVLSYDD